MKIQENWKKNALVSPKDYEDLYNLSIKDNEGFGRIKVIAQIGLRNIQK